MIRRVQRVFRRLKSDCSGATLIEYGLLVTIAAIIIFSLSQLGIGVNGTHGSVAARAANALN